MFTKRQAPCVITVTWELCHTSPQLHLSRRGSQYVAAPSFPGPLSHLLCRQLSYSAHSLASSKGVPGREKQPLQQYQRWRKSEPVPFPFLKIPSCIQVSAKSVCAQHPSTPSWAPQLTSTAGTLWTASPLCLPLRHFPGKVSQASVDTYRHMQLPTFLHIAVFCICIKCHAWIETCLSLIKGFSELEFFTEVFAEPGLQHFHTCKLHFKKPDCWHLSDK